MTGKAVFRSLLFFLIAFAVSLSIYTDTIVYNLLSMYSSIIKGREIAVRNIRISVPSRWYIWSSKTKIFRIPDAGTPVAIALYEIEDVEPFLQKVRTEVPAISPNIRIGKYEAYKFLFDKPCTGVQADCYHAIIMIPALNLKITVSNYLRDQTFILNEVIGSDLSILENK